MTSLPMQRNTFLYRMGEAAKGCFVVRSGVFETVALTSNGEEHVTGFYYPGELIGFSGQATGEFSDTAVALTSSTACRFSISDFPDLFAIGAGASLLRLIAEREETDRLLQINLRQSRAEARIAGFLYLLSSRLINLGYATTCLPLPMSRTDLANHLGLTLECLSRILGKWRRAGAITTERNHLSFADPALLRTLACHLNV